MAQPKPGPRSKQLYGQEWPARRVSPGYDRARPPLPRQSHEVHSCCRITPRVGRSPRLATVVFRERRRQPTVRLLKHVVHTVASEILNLRIIVTHMPWQLTANASIEITSNHKRGFAAMPNAKSAGLIPPALNKMHVMGSVRSMKPHKQQLKSSASKQDQKSPWISVFDTEVLLAESHNGMSAICLPDQAMAEPASCPEQKGRKPLVLTVPCSQRLSCMRTACSCPFSKL